MRHRLTDAARALPCALVMAAGCSGGEARWAGTMTDSAGVMIVTNTDVGMWPPGEEWTFEEEVRIGAADSTPEYMFGSVHRIAVDSRDRILVLDGIAQHIQVYSPDGAFQQTIGGPGEGPGEFRAAMFLLVGPGDSLLIPDGRLLRFNRYAPDGSSVGSSSMPLEAGMPITFKATASGAIAEQIRIRPSATPGQPGTEDRVDVIILLAVDGTVTDTLMTFPSGELLGAGGVRVYAPEPAWDLTNDLHLVLGVTDEYRISVYVGGELQRVISKPFERKPVDQQDRDAIMGEMERRWVAFGLSPEDMEGLRTNWHFADFLPAFRSLVVGPRGTIWVQHVRPASALTEEELVYWHLPQAAEWDVFDPEGRFLGVVTMPPRFTPTVFRDDRVYGDWRDESGVQFVVRLRIVGDLGD